MELITINGIEYEGGNGITERREDFETFLLNVNGCGAGNAKFDLVPDTNNLRSITHICNLHDDDWTFCEPTRKAFDEANLRFKRNHIKWAKEVSNFIMRPRRIARAELYYLFVDSAIGWKAFCDCKEKLGTPVIGDGATE